MHITHNYCTGKGQFLLYIKIDIVFPNYFVYFSDNDDLKDAIFRMNEMMECI